MEEFLQKELEDPTQFRGCYMKVPGIRRYRSVTSIKTKI